MRAFIMGVAAALLIALGAAYVLNEFQKPAETAVKIDSIRI